jgi:alkylation response protein AidB-like acyl-CoA dehydrogenase
MDLGFSAADEAFRTEVRAFIEAHWPIASRRPRGVASTYGRNRNPDQQHWFDALVERGWSVPNWPVELGGSGWSVTQKFIWDRETTAAETPQMSAFGTNMLAPVLYTWGTAEQQAQHLPPIREARRIWCQGYSEPGAGSDLAKISTRAQRRDGHYLVTGEKTWTSGAHLADWMFCLVRTDPAAAKPQAGISFLLIDMRSAGVEVRPITTLGGQHTVNSVRLNDVLVPLANRIGEENSGWTYAKNLLTHERTGVARVGMSKVQLSRLKTLARNTEEDGVSLWSDAGFRAKVHALEIDLMGLEILELRTLANLSSGAAPGPESSILKLAGSEIGQRIVQLQVETFGYYALPYPDQILLDNEGPIGDEYAVPAMQGMLFSRAWSVYGGANEIQKNIIAK